ncbi:TonB-dependent receptor [Aquimarina aquimarini]|uniref:TonB-dependent receptor n=1 Tax=Aquimarina aquimarini TaxID=1191734 RepID=UPI000D54EA9E|nr:TonB-dependent receptor [Aquimarina aquimarini]
MIQRSIHIICLLFCLTAYSQDLYSVKIKVVDKDTNTPLVGAHISINNKHTVTNTEGDFYFKNILAQEYTLSITHIGYKPYHTTIEIPLFAANIIAIEANQSVLEEVIVSGDTNQKRIQKSSLSKLEVKKDFLEQNRENSLMQTLKKIPGVSSISIGSGQSKPVIRGLGFNRVVVVENGIKHEAQQWATDHGLEIDQYNVEELEITKGASSLLYGSDAIAGVIAIKSGKLLAKNSFSGEVHLTGRSNNDLFGVSAGIKKRYDNWYYKARITHQNYGDYKVPTDQIYYENYVFNLHKNYLRNTAGQNYDISSSIGYVSDHFQSETIITNVNAKSGFFANAHGLEVRTSQIDYDANNRDIDLPHHKVNHLKIINNSKITLPDHTLILEVGYQNNHREEHSEPVPHGYMPTPSSTKERRFIKNTYSINVKDHIHAFDTHKIALGINAEYQNNTIGGWGFLIPEYNRLTIGAFAYDQYKITDSFYLEGGLRYDYGTVHTKPYYEWFDSPITNSDGTITQERRQRSSKTNLEFGSYSASVGISYLKKNSSYKLNLGKSFRIPLASELASDGVNYHMYRYEEGSIDLKPENSYQIDGELNATINNFEIQLNPFVNYFENYIYLNPTPAYYETLQRYQYTQSEVFRYGGELTALYTPSPAFSLSASLEYVYSKQLSGDKKNFTLPFSPPLSTIFSAKYNINSWWFFKKTSVFSDLRITAKQNDIVPPERPTDGFSLLNFGVQTETHLFSQKHPLQIQCSVNNVLDKKIFDHTSFYRLIQVPEPGRNVSISILQKF